MQRTLFLINFKLFIDINQCITIISKTDIKLKIKSKSKIIIQFSIKNILII